TLDLIGEAEAGRLEVTLHAHLHLSFRIEPRRIHDGGADVLRFRAGDLSRPYMLAARSVTSLAIDTHGQTAGEHGLGAALSIRGRRFQIAVVTEHAVVSHFAPEALMIRPIIAWIHGPV